MRFVSVAVLLLLEGALCLAVCFVLGAGPGFDCGVETLGMPIAPPRFTVCFFCADDPRVDCDTSRFSTFEF